VQAAFTYHDRTGVCFIAKFFDEKKSSGHGFFWEAARLESKAGAPGAEGLALAVANTILDFYKKE
jgi:hypothetical protein